MKVKSIHEPLYCPCTINASYDAAYVLLDFLDNKILLI